MLSSRSPPRNGASPGDVRNTAPIAPRRLGRSSPSRAPRVATGSGGRTARRRRALPRTAARPARARRLVQRAEHDHGHRPARGWRTAGSGRSRSRDRDRAPPARARRRRRCPAPTPPRAGSRPPRSPTRSSPAGISSNAQPAVASVESTSARVVPSRVSASWLHSGAATTLASAIADSTSPMRSGLSPRACSSGVKNGNRAAVATPPSANRPADVSIEPDVRARLRLVRRDRHVGSSSCCQASQNDGAAQRRGSTRTTSPARGEITLTADPVVLGDQQVPARVPQRDQMIRPKVGFAEGADGPLGDGAAQLDVVGRVEVRDVVWVARCRSRRRTGRRRSPRRARRRPRDGRRGTGRRTGSSIDGPRSSSGTPHARCAATGANTSRPWNVEETAPSQNRGSVRCTTWMAHPSRSARAKTHDSTPLSGPTNRCEPTVDGDRPALGAHARIHDDMCTVPRREPEGVRWQGGTRPGARRTGSPRACGPSRRPRGRSARSPRVAPPGCPAGCRSRW